MIPYWIIWIAAIFAGATIGMNTYSFRRARQHRKRVESYWSEHAPPAPDVLVRLKTGDTLTLSPTSVHQAWVWILPMPVRPDEVDELIVPELPPFTQIVPVQAK